MVKTTHQPVIEVGLRISEITDSKKNIYRIFFDQPPDFFGSNGFSSTNLPSGKRYCNSSLLKLAHLWLISH
jgi:hypothetical protein